MIKDRHKTIILSSIFSGIFLLFLFLNFKTFLAMDDFIYSMTRTQKHLSSFGDVIISLRGFRSYVNGRIFAHFFAKIFLCLPKWVFNIVNPVITTSLFFVIYKYIDSGKSPYSLIVFAIISAFIVIFIPAFGQIFLWLTGSCNYSWAAFILLLYLYPYYMDYRFEYKQPLRFCVLHAILSFFAGAYSEHASFGSLCIAFVFFVLVFIRDRKLPVSLFVSGFVSCTGYLFLMLAPIEWAKQKGGSLDYSVMTSIIEKLPKVNYLFYAAAAIGFLLLVFAVARYKWFRKFAVPFCACSAYVLLSFLLVRNENSLISIFSNWKFNVLSIYFVSFGLIYFSYGKIDSKAWTCSLVFACGAVAGILLFFFATYISARVFCVPCVFSAISIGIILSAIVSDINVNAFRKTAVVLVLICTVFFSFGIKDIINCYNLSVQRDAYIQYTAGVLNERDIVVPRIYPETKYAPCWPGDSEEFTMDMENYYGINGFRLQD